MKRKPMIPTSWDEAFQITRDPNAPRMVAPNTMLRCEYTHHGSVRLRYQLVLHGTKIVEWEGDTVRLWSGGYTTHTTKDRLNRALEGHARIQGGPVSGWALLASGGRERVDFSEGMELDLATGDVTTPTSWSARCHCYNGHASNVGRCTERDIEGTICPRCRANCATTGTN